MTYMKPYYEDKYTELYHCDCEEFLRLKDFRQGNAPSLVITDPSFPVNFCPICGEKTEPLPEISLEEWLKEYKDNEKSTA